MKSSFEFMHRGQQVLAELLYNFDVVSNMILVLPLVIVGDFNEYLLFTQKKEKKWYEETHISIRFPETFRDLAKRLTNHFSKENFSFFPNPSFTGQVLPQPHWQNSPDQPQ